MSEGDKQNGSSSTIYVTENESKAPLNSRIQCETTNFENSVYPSIYKDHFSSLLIPQDIIQSRTAEIAKSIHAKYPHDEPLVILCILKGSNPFFGYLCQQLSLLGHPYMIDFYRAKSYEGTKSSGNVKMLHDLPESVVGRNVLVVEDIVDTGNTLKALLPKIFEKKPVSCKVCTLLVKRLTDKNNNESDDSESNCFSCLPSGPISSEGEKDILEGNITEHIKLEEDLVGFSVPDKFVVGCGLDYNEMYRDLLDVWVLGNVGIQGGGYGL